LVTICGIYGICVVLANRGLPHELFARYQADLFYAFKFLFREQKEK
jgi:hypothetical protein